MNDVQNSIAVLPTEDGSAAETTANAIINSDSESAEPTIFIGPDGSPIYDSEVTKIDGSDKKAAELTANDEGITVFCEGFQYFKEPEGVAYNSYENPEMFEG